MMDTSETYIKMCDHPVIQDIVIRRLKQDHGWLRTSAVGDICNAIAKNGDVFTFYLDIWLPRQDQLQAIMLRNDVASLMELLRSVVIRYHDRFDENTVGYRNGTFSSMEQLWLALVMSWLHHKTWAGKEWI